MGNAPKISILLPCYRQEAWVTEALESIRQQNFPDWEVVASDDASPDGTAETLERFSRREERIRSFRQKKNLGMVENRNFCLNQARGVAIKLMGGDDRLEGANCLACQWESLQPSGIALVASGRQWLDERGGRLRTEATFSQGRYPGPAVRNRILTTQINLVGEPVCVLFRKDLASRGFNPAYSQLTDLEFWFHLLEQGALFYLPDPLAGFRIHARQQSQLNWQSGLSLEEHFRLLLAEAKKGGLKAETRRSLALWTWRMSPQLSRPSAQELEEGMKELRRQMGFPGFRLALASDLLQRRMSRWAHSLRKRIRPQKPAPEGRGAAT